MNDSVWGEPSAFNLIVPNADAGETVDLHHVGVASSRTSGFSLEHLAAFKFKGRQEFRSVL